MKMTIAIVAGLLGYDLIGLLEASEPAGPQVKVITNSVGMKLALIPAATFLMGSPATEKERADEELQHKVTITKPFYMGVYEVTQRDFSNLMGPPRRGLDRAIFDKSRGGGPDHPMENVHHKTAVEFCHKLTALADERRAGRKYRLPTEAEWEYACRAGTTTAFHFGDTFSSKQANFNGNYPHGGAQQGPYLRKTAKVGSYKPNAFGLYDMHGNVAEWCADWYDKDYYSKSPKTDPPGPKQGVLSTGYKTFYLVARGGCWLDDARACRAAFRFRAMPRNKYRLIGFRVVCDVAEKNP